MNKTIAVICNNKNCLSKLQEAGTKLNVNIKYEIQSNGKIENKLSEDEILDTNAILFVIDGEVEDIEDIERFIDCEYYEVNSKLIIEKTETVIKEIIDDLN